jgi:CO/xanthine dehydrogenase Mo-binding subunit
MVELSVSPGTGKVNILSHKTWLECGTQIVPELVSGQIQGGVAMGMAMRCTKSCRSMRPAPATASGV